MKKLWLLWLSVLGGCLGMPEAVQPVSDFELNRYLGKWYEIARLDHSFEEGLSRVTANYRRREGGGIAVVNRGYSVTDEEWQEAEGKAYFVNEPDEGYFKVSFFGPFYSSYVIFHLDNEAYQYAFISGPDTNYLWLLARTPSVDPDIIERFVSMAQARGFNTDNLIYVEHEE